MNLDIRTPPEPAWDSSDSLKRLSQYCSTLARKCNQAFGNVPTAADISAIERGIAALEARIEVLENGNKS